MIYRALTMTIPLDSERSIPGSASLPDTSSPRWNSCSRFRRISTLRSQSLGRASSSIERGFIKGFVDLVVEHEGRVYFADWKSDVLPSYESDRSPCTSTLTMTPGQAVLARAREGARIDSEAEYEKSFGGLFYVFLRALSQNDDESQGVYFERPAGPISCSTRPSSSDSSSGPERGAHEGANRPIAAGHGARGIASASPAPVPGSTAASEQDLLGWYRKIREPLKALYNLEDEIAFIAWELARWQDGLELIEQQALILLILTVLVHLRQGSTRIRLRGQEGRSLRLDLASRLLKGSRAGAGHD